MERLKWLSDLANLRRSSGSTCALGMGAPRWWGTFVFYAVEWLCVKYFTSFASKPVIHPASLGLGVARGAVGDSVGSEAGMRVLC